MIRKKPIKVIIADDHPVIRIGIRYHLERAAGITVVGEATNGQEAIRLARELSPDVLILDLRMPVMDGIQVLRVLHQEMPGLKVLVISEDDDECRPADTLAMGACGHIQKSQDPRCLVKAARQAVRRKEKSERPNKLLFQKASWGRGPISFA